MAIVDDNLFPKIIIRESADDGSDFSNPAADHRVLFLGEDGDLHLKDSAGSVTDIGGVAGGAPAAHGARVKRSADVSVGNNILTVIPFTAEDFDTDTIHDNSTNPSRLIIPSISGVTTGLWSIKATGYTDAVTGAADVVLRVGAAGNPASGTPIAFQRYEANAALTAYGTSTDYVFTAGDYVECFVRTTAATHSVIFDAGVSPLFSIAFLGKVT